jgi:acyl-CoA dehydrogenase
MDLNHLAWPFFDSACVEFATNFDRWACAELGPFEQNEGGDGVAARQIFELLAAGGWLRATLPTETSWQRDKAGLRQVSLMREITAFSSAMADVALSEPWLGILPIALYGSPTSGMSCCLAICRAGSCPHLHYPSPTPGQMPPPSRRPPVATAITT